jgi:hypothetical protein
MNWLKILEQGMYYTCHVFISRILRLDKTVCMELDGKSDYARKQRMDDFEWQR